MPKHRSCVVHFLENPYLWESMPVGEGNPKLKVITIRETLFSTGLFD